MMDTGFDCFHGSKIVNFLVLIKLPWKYVYVCKRVPEM